jgi:hypothetical protein
MFTVITDHKPFIWIFKMNDPNCRIMRLKLKLEKFDYTIIYKKEKENLDSDGLSRIYEYIMTTEDAGAELSSEEVGAEKEKGRSQPLDAGTNGEPEEVEEKNTGLSDKEKLEILQELHETPIGGHIGMNRTYKRLKHYISWEGMKEDVETFINKCEKCQKNKLTQCHTRMSLTITDTPSVVFEMWT